MSEVLDDYPTPLLEALAAHELLRKLGFSPEQIFIHRNPKPRPDIVVVLRHNGKQLALTVGVLRLAAWEALWTDLVEKFNGDAISDAEFKDWYERSWAGRHHVEILMALESKGIEPPCGAN